MLEYHLEKLGSFYATAQERSVLGAAKKLRITQPGITKNIRALEEHLGVTLFVRHRRGMDLTKSGRLLLTFCDTLFLKVKDFEKQVKSDKELSGVVRIGTYETLGELFWPKVLRELNFKYPDLSVELTTQNPDTIWERLESGAVDLVVDAEPRTADHLISHVLYSDQFGVFCKKSSRFKEQMKNIPISFVRRAYDRNETSIEQHLRKHNLAFELLYDVESFTMVRSLILEDVCIGVLPLRMARSLIRSGAICAFEFKGNLTTFGEHRICATSLESNKREPKFSTLIHLLKNFHRMK